MTKVETRGARAALSWMLSLVFAVSLGPVWAADLSGVSRRAFEATPLMVDGRPFVSVGGSIALANDAKSGRELWRFYTVPPRPGTKDGAASDQTLATVMNSWSGDWWKLGGGGKGDNLFLSSSVAVRGRTGEYVWHFQTTPGDEWDYTDAHNWQPMGFNRGTGLDGALAANGMPAFDRDLNDLDAGAVRAYSIERATLGRVR